MSRMLNMTWRTLFLALIISSCAAAQATRPATQASDNPPAKASEKLSVTEHEITIDGQVLRYRARAGYLPIRDEAGKETARFFFVAYEKIQENPRLRPLTFVFNGGPGAAAVWMHLGTAGPKRIALADPIGEAPPPPYQLVDNEATWLDVTDLVFIDPVGTGFSRPAAGAKGEAFFGVQEDVQSVANFIRLYITQYERWLSPKFLAGESYGSTRAAALSEYLVDRYGIALNGIMLISVVLDFQTIEIGRGNDLPYALFLPSYTATAWYFEKLDEPLQKDLLATLEEVREFALGDYITALVQGSEMPEATRKIIIEKLARYTGLSEDVVRKSNLRIQPSDFRNLLLTDRPRIIGRFDSRITGYDLQPMATWSAYDPSLTKYLAVYSATFNDYVRRALGFKSELPYEILTDRVQPWNWGQRGTGGFVNVTDELRAAMAKLPYMRVLFASGYYDLATPYLAAEYTIDHLDVGPELRKNITHEYYRAGHMMYHDAESRRKLKRDVAAFIRGGGAAAAEQDDAQQVR